MPILKHLMTVLFLFPLPAHAGSTIFFHPDGMGVNTWAAVRNVTVGPDGELEWDKLPHVAVYKGHLSDGLTPSSNGGATIHAYGQKAPREAFGMLNEQTLSIAHEALKAGKGLGLVNSGSIIEPGSAAFVARVGSRSDAQDITEQVIDSGAQVILSGGEEWMLPKGATGRHSKGKRRDGKNLIERAQALGYKVVYDANELAAIDPSTTKKLLGVFAAGHMFHDVTPGVMAAKDLPFFIEGAPSIGEMTDKALAMLQMHHADGFLLIAEEEGTDNFGNKGNVAGQLESGMRADEAIGVIARFIAAHPNTSMFTTSDSDAGGLQLVDCGESISSFFRLSACKDGASFTSQPDAAGKRYQFNTLTTGTSDVAGGVVVRGAGKHGALVRGTMDNTQIHSALKAALFDAGSD